MIVLVEFAASRVPGSTINPDLVTPGVIGFVVSAIVAIATILLLVDMNRRVRRVRFREEARTKIAAEVAASHGEGTSAQNAVGGSASANADGPEDAERTA